MTVKRSDDFSYNEVVTENCPDNCLNDMVERAGGVKAKITMNVTGTGPISANVFKVIGSCKIIDAYGEIDSVTTLTNFTAAKFFLDDGTATVDITATGAVLSGMPPGTLILKTKDSTNPADIIDASQCQVTEADSTKKTHHPFIVTQKNGVDTYIKMSGTTTDNPVNFTVTFYVHYIPLDGGYVVAAS